MHGRASGKRRTCSAVLSELIAGGEAFIAANGNNPQRPCAGAITVAVVKIIALMREEQVRLLLEFCLGL